MLKLKQNIRWIIPLILIVIAAASFVLVPAVGSAHAAMWHGF